MIALVNWQQEEPNGCGGGQQLLMNGTSRVNREIYARFCERLGVKFPGPTRRYWVTSIPTATDPEGTPSRCDSGGGCRRVLQDADIGKHAPAPKVIAEDNDGATPLRNTGLRGHKDVTEQ